MRQLEESFLFWISPSNDEIDRMVGRIVAEMKYGRLKYVGEACSTIMRGGGREVSRNGRLAVVMLFCGGKSG